MKLHSSIHHGYSRQDQHCQWHGHLFPSSTEHTDHVQQGRNIISFTLLSAVLVRLLCPLPSTCESGALAGENCQVSVDQLDVYKML